MANNGIMKYYGGKAYIAPWLIPHFPKRYTTYVEPFIGAGNVYLSLPNHSNGIDYSLHDASPDIISIYHALQSAKLAKELLSEIRSLNWKKDYRGTWWDVYHKCVPVSQPAYTYIKYGFSFSGFGDAPSGVDTIDGRNRLQGFYNRLYGSGKTSIESRFNAITHNPQVELLR